MNNNEKVNQECLKHITEGIILACNALSSSTKSEAVDKFNVYWTYIGLLFLVNDIPSYFFHNNGSIFIFDKKDGGYRIGVLTDSFVNNSGWMLSFLEMQHGILVRSIMEDASVPDVRKLLKLGENGLLRLDSLIKEVTWITC